MQNLQENHETRATHEARFIVKRGEASMKNSLIWVYKGSWETLTTF